MRCGWESLAVGFVTVTFPPARSPLALDVLVLPAGVGEGAVGEYDLLVAAVAGALQDLEGEVELPVSRDIGVAVYTPDPIIVLGVLSVSGLALVGLDIRSTVGEPLAQGNRRNVDAALVGLPT